MKTGRESWITLEADLKKPTMPSPTSKPRSNAYGNSYDAEYCKSLNDFIRESNRYGHIHFVSTLEKAKEQLLKKKYYIFPILLWNR